MLIFLFLSVVIVVFFMVADITDQFSSSHNSFWCRVFGHRFYKVKYYGLPGELPFAEERFEVSHCLRCGTKNYIQLSGFEYIEDKTTTKEENMKRLNNNKGFLVGIPLVGFVITSLVLIALPARAVIENQKTGQNSKNWQSIVAHAQGACAEGSTDSRCITK